MSTPVTFRLLVVLVESGCFSAFVRVWVKLDVSKTPSLYHENEGRSLPVATHDKRNIASLLTVSLAAGLLVSSGGSKQRNFINSCLKVTEKMKSRLLLSIMECLMIRKKISNNLMKVKNS